MEERERMNIKYVNNRKKNAQIRLCIQAGSLADGEGKEGTAHLLEHVNLLFDKFGKYGTDSKFRAYGYTNFFNTTYVFETPDELIHIYRVLEIINRILNGWFIEHYEVDVAKQDIDKEISKLEENPIVKQIIRGTNFEKKDPRNKSINIYNISLDDIREYSQRHYINGNYLILIESKIGRKTIEAGVNLLLSDISKNTRKEKIYLNWKENFMFLKSKTEFVGCVLKIENLYKKETSTLELCWLKWALEKCIKALYKNTASQFTLTEVLFSPYEILLWLQCKELNFHIFETIANLHTNWFKTNCSNQIFFDEFLCKYDYQKEKRCDKIEIEEKEYIYKRKLILDENVRKYEMAKKLDIEKLSETIKFLVSMSNILPLY